MRKLLTMEDRLILADFENETAVLTEQIDRELNVFDLETRLVEKGVL